MNDEIINNLQFFNCVKVEKNGSILGKMDVRQIKNILSP